MRLSESKPADVVVVGAGFGGLGAALTLADAGARVVLCERLNYPGGCASTFSRGGARYESGATMFAGFGPGQLMRQWMDRFDLDIGVRLLDPVVRFHADGRSFDVPRDREAFVARMEAECDARPGAVRGFFEDQARVADALWALFDDPEMLPPLTLGSLGRHLVRSPRYLPVLRWIGHPVADVLAAHGLADVEPLRTWLDAVCQITVQAGVDEAEAPFALSAMDYFFRGTAVIDGGIGRLADALVGAIRARGGDVRLSSRVRGLRRTSSGWQVDTRTGAVDAPVVIANLLPQTAAKLAGVPEPPLARRVEQGWGAAMLYLLVDDESFGEHEPLHRQVVVDPTRPCLEGNHALLSVGDPQWVDGERVRAVTVSTHLYPRDDRAYVELVQLRLRDIVARTVPHWRIVRELTASPRTFERFTGRPGGLVGGVPRRVSLDHYLGMFRGPLARGLYLVGDSVFPGQSTLACAIGGQRVANRVLSGRSQSHFRYLKYPSRLMDTAAMTPSSTK